MSRMRDAVRQVRRVPGVSAVLRRLRPSPRDRLLRLIPSQTVGAEIGVWRGDFSARLLMEADPAELHLIDPWRFQPEFPTRWYGGTRAATQADMDAIYEGVVTRFEKYPQVSIHRMSSEQVPERFPPNSLDWIYIDGDHSQESVLKDLENGWEVLRPGGLLLGDDLFWQDADGSESVRDAVERFVADRNLPDVEGIGNQFVIVKGG